MVAAFVRFPQGAKVASTNLMAVYIFMGTLCFEQFTILYISGSIIVFSGIVYAALEFVPSIEPPSNMRDADAGWGAEEV